MSPRKITDCENEKWNPHRTVSMHHSMKSTQGQLWVHRRNRYQRPIAGTFRGPNGVPAPE